MNFRKILVIDDDVDDQEILLSALARVSNLIECDACSNAEIALDKLKKKQLHPDVIFLDLNMPVMSGQEFLKEIKTEDDIRNIPVIIFSTSSNQATVKSTMDMGAFHFITKPDRFDKLIDILIPIIK